MQLRVKPYEKLSVWAVGLKLAPRHAGQHFREALFLFDSFVEAEKFYRSEEVRKLHASHLDNELGLWEVI